MRNSKLAPAVAGLGAALAMLAVPSAASAQSTSGIQAQTHAQAQTQTQTQTQTQAQAQALGVHRKSASCTSPSGQKINVSWGDGNVSTTVYFNNHCNQKRWVELKFVKQNHDFFWKCFSVNPRTSGKKKVDNSNPDQVVLTKKKTNC